MAGRPTRHPVSTFTVAGWALVFLAGAHFVSRPQGLVMARDEAGASRHLAYPMSGVSWILVVQCAAEHLSLWLIESPSPTGGALISQHVYTGNDVLMQVAS